MKFYFVLFPILVFADSSPLQAKSSKYSRNEFKHWIDTDRDCQNTRQELLISRSLAPVTFKNKKNCTVASGKWNDFYYPEIHTKAGNVDIDHIIPLKHAWDQGADKWTKERRQEFANDPENLAITNRKYNRQKGAQTPLSWTPINREYNCNYLAQWIRLKKKYSLAIDQKIYQYQKRANCLKTLKIETH